MSMSVFNQTLHDNPYQVSCFRTNLDDPELLQMSQENLKTWRHSKQGKATTVQDHSGQCLIEEQQILNQWTEYCSELYNYKANGDPSILKCPETNSEDYHPILCREVEAAVQSLKKGTSQHPNRTGASRWRGCNHRSHNNLQQDLADRRMANPIDPVLSHHTFQERQFAADLQNNKPHQSPEQSHATGHTERIEATSGEDHRWRTGRLQSRKEYHRADLQPMHSIWEISPAPARRVYCSYTFVMEMDRINIYQCQNEHWLKPIYPIWQVERM